MPRSLGRTRTLSRMKTALLLLFALVAAPAYAQGQMAFETESYEFGTFDEGEIVTHTFAFTNAGDAPLTLTEVRTSCGCTTPAWTSTPVAPGEAGEVVVAYNSANRPGPFDKTVTLVADGAEPRGLTLRIRGRVVPGFVAGGVAQGGLTFATDLHDVGAVTNAEPVQRTFRFQNTGATPVRVREARTFVDGVQVVLPTHPVFPGDIMAAIVTIDPATAARADGRLDVAVVLDTDDADQPTKSLRIRGRLDG